MASGAWPAASAEPASAGLRGSVGGALLELGLLERGSLARASSSATGGDSAERILLRSGEVSGRAFVLAARHRWGLAPLGGEPVLADAGSGAAALAGHGTSIGWPQVSWPGLALPHPEWGISDPEVRARLARLLRILSTATATAGVVVGANLAIMLAWKDPLTSLVAAHNQGVLEQRLAAIEPAVARPHRAHDATGEHDRIAALAAREAGRTSIGDPIGRIEAPTVGIRFAVVEGDGADELTKGPGHYPGTAFPGQGRTVAIAGHRTTYLAPFRNLDDLRPGDPITMTMPYGIVTYRVERTRIVDPDDVWIADDANRERLVLSACEPLYSAAHRIVVFAKRTGLTT